MCGVRRELRVGVGAERWACVMHVSCAVSPCGAVVVVLLCSCVVCLFVVLPVVCCVACAFTLCGV